MKTVPSANGKSKTGVRDIRNLYMRLFLYNEEPKLETSKL
jgi:hypothetical protein